jgi:uncharacterized membrane protein
VVVLNDAGQVVGTSGGYATEWASGEVIDLGGLSRFSSSAALAINNTGQVVGSTYIPGYGNYATEWSGVVGGSIINLDNLPRFTNSGATSINDAGQVVGESSGYVAAPELSTWAMMLIGFVSLGYAGYRHSERVVG